MSEAFTRPPKENLFRAVHELTLERAAASDALPVMKGHFAVFNEWTEIKSRIEGHFLERIAPGAFAKTFRENRDRMRVLFQHGNDPVIGDKPLGPIAVLEEDDTGAYYEVPLLDTTYNRDLLPALKEGLYGASFRFTVMKEDFVRRPTRSAHNPDGIPERTVSEARVPEFGPVTFPAYEGASAGCRSITDEIVFERLAREDARGRSTASFGARGEDEEARSERRYSRCIEVVGGTPWAITPDALATIVAIIGERADGHKPSEDEIQERIGARAARADTPAGPVCVLPLCGPIVPRADFFSEVSGAASVEGFLEEFREALADPTIGAILIDVDSPGGDVSLVPELAAEIRAARGGETQIVAIANTLAASAAYWIASACDEVVVTPSGEVGSIGVYSAHQDVSAAQKKLGVKTTLVSAGDYKVERNPFEPLSKEAEAAMQEKVDAYYDMFVEGVAAGRGVSTEEVLANYGQGRTLMAPKALAAGMVDEVATFDETLRRLTADAAAALAAEEPEPDEAAATPTEPEPSEATTQTLMRVPLWFAQLPNEGEE